MPAAGTRWCLQPALSKPTWTAGTVWLAGRGRRRRRRRRRIHFEFWVMVVCATWRFRSLVSRRRTLGPRVRKDDDVFSVSVSVPASIGRRRSTPSFAHSPVLVLVHRPPFSYTFPHTNTYSFSFSLEWERVRDTSACASPGTGGRVTGTGTDPRLRRHPRAGGDPEDESVDAVPQETQIARMVVKRVARTPRLHDTGSPPARG